jgi:hypothetical protein
MTYAEEWKAMGTIFRDSSAVSCWTRVVHSKGARIVLEQSLITVFTGITPMVGVLRSILRPPININTSMVAIFIFPSSSLSR